MVSGCALALPRAGTCGEAMGPAWRQANLRSVPLLWYSPFGQVADNELLFALPASYADDFLDGLEKTHARISPYPIENPDAPRIRAAITWRST